MASHLDDTMMNHLSDLARVRLTEEEKKRFLHDIQKVLDHFEDLKAIPTDAVEPMPGGAFVRDVFREDSTSDTQTSRGASGTESFPKKEGGYLEVPKVFS